MKTEVKYLGNTEGELFTSWHYVKAGGVKTKQSCEREEMSVEIWTCFDALRVAAESKGRRRSIWRFVCFLLSVGSGV